MFSEKVVFSVRRVRILRVGWRKPCRDRNDQCRGNSACVSNVIASRKWEYAIDLEGVQQQEGDEI
jgi:hypothetical protein